MIKFNIGKENYSIPVSWYEVRFDQYCEFIKIKDDLLQVVSLFSGVNYEFLKNGKIKGLEDIIRAMHFLQTPPEFTDVTSKIGPYDLPITGKKKFDIQFESLAQFEDMRKIMMAVPEKDFEAHIAAYPKYCAIYLQAIRDGEYDYNKAMDMVEDVYAMPMHEVMVVGAFFFLKLRILSTGTQANSRPTNHKLKKSQPGSINSRKRSVTTRR